MRLADQEEGDVTLRIRTDTAPATAHFVGDRRGEPEEIDGLCARFTIPAERYACFVTSKVRLEFDVFLTRDPTRTRLAVVPIVTSAE